MNGILAPVLWIFSLVYIDDIMVYYQSYEEHLMHLDQVLQAVKEAQIMLSPKKCHFTYTSILLLGQKVCHLGLSTHVEKVKATMELATPTNVCTLQSFLGMAIYFSHYIPTSQDTPCWQLPSLNSRGKKVKWEWGKDQETAFCKVQKTFASAPMLGHPTQGYPFWVYSNASNVAVGACLPQVQPIHLGDMKGTKFHDFVIEAHQRGLSIPWIAKLVLVCTPGIPSPEKWAEPLEDTILQVE